MVGGEFFQGVVTWNKLTGKRPVVVIGYDCGTAWMSTNCFEQSAAMEVRALLFSDPPATPLNILS
jgi:hypothetical protein